MDDGAAEARARAKAKAHELLGYGKWESCRDAGHPFNGGGDCDRLTALLVAHVAEVAALKVARDDAREDQRATNQHFIERLTKLRKTDRDAYLRDYGEIKAERDAARAMVPECPVHVEALEALRVVHAATLVEVERLRAVDTMLRRAGEANSLRGGYGSALAEVERDALVEHAVRRIEEALPLSAREYWSEYQLGAANAVKGAVARVRALATPRAETPK